MESIPAKRGTEDTALGRRHLNTHSCSCTFLIHKCWQNLSFGIYTRFHNLPSWIAKGSDPLSSILYYTLWLFILIICPTSSSLLMHLLEKTLVKASQLLDQRVQPLAHHSVIHLHSEKQLNSSHHSPFTQWEPPPRALLLLVLSNHRQEQSPKKSEGWRIKNNWTNIDGRKPPNLHMQVRASILFSRRAWRGGGWS